MFDIPGTLLSETEPTENAQRRLIQTVLGAGGTITHRYNVVMVRAILPVAAVPGLPVSAVYGVVDPSRHDVKAFVGFRGGIAPSAIESRGGSLLMSYDAFGIVLALLRDAVIPSLRLDPRIRFVEHALDIGCLADAS